MSSPIESSVKAIRPSFILYADKPLEKGGKVEELALEEFEKRLGISYSDSIDLGQDVNLSQIHFDEYVEGPIPSSELAQQVFQLLTKGNTNLALYAMGNLGHGAFAAKRIEKDTVIAVYAGTIIFGHQSENFADEGLHFKESNFSFSTAQHRGIASFLQHLPIKPMFKDVKSKIDMLKRMGEVVDEVHLKLNEELYCTEFSTKKVKESIATINVRKEYIKYNGFPMIVFVTEEAIKQGEIIGFNYGSNYWASRECVPEYFDKKGNVIAHSIYKKTFGDLHFGHCSYVGNFAPLIEQFLKKKVAKFTLTDNAKKKQVITLEKLAIALLQARALTREEIAQFTSLAKEVKAITSDEKKDK